VFTGRRIATRLDERVHRWVNWFRDRIRAGDNEQQLTPAFAAHEAEELCAGGATEEQVRDYETADPSSMAVSAALRYWRKYHHEEVSIKDQTSPNSDR